jgi:hypothetical protein
LRALASRSEGATRETLVLFVRQFACAGCGEQVQALLLHVTALRALGVRVVIVGCGNAEQARGFDERIGVTSRGVELFTDPTLAVQRAAGLPRTFMGVNGPRAVVGLVRAMLNGHPNAWSGGDYYQQGGVLLVDGELRVLFFHAQRWLGDLVDIGDITDIVLASRAREKSAEKEAPESDPRDEDAVRA